MFTTLRLLEVMKKLNGSIGRWVHYESNRRMMNLYFLVLYFMAALIGLFVNPLALFLFLVIGLFQGMANVVHIMGRPEILSSEAQVREFAATGPKWFQKLISKLDSQE